MPAHSGEGRGWEGRGSSDGVAPVGGMAGKWWWRGSDKGMCLPPKQEKVPAAPLSSSHFPAGLSSGSQRAQGKLENVIRVQTPQAWDRAGRVKNKSTKAQA